MELGRNPLRNHSLQLIQLIIKEMSRALDHPKLGRRVRGNSLNYLAQTIHVAVFIMFAVYEQNRFTALLEKTEVVLIDRRANAD